MRVLWCIAVPSIFPEFAEVMNIPSAVTGGWIQSLAHALGKYGSGSSQLAVAAHGNTRHLVKAVGKTGIVYYLLPGGTKSLWEYESHTFSQDWEKVVADFAPDIIHIHGTEFAHGYHITTATNNRLPVVISIQGLVSRLARYYTAGLTRKEILFNVTVHDIVKRDSIYQHKQGLVKRGKREEALIRRCHRVIGRTDWDRANVTAIDPEARYYHCDENMREEFYNRSWNVDAIEQYSVFTGRMDSPIKGLHILLRAFKLVIQDFPMARLYISGMTLSECSQLRSRIRDTNYLHYIRHLIKALQLTDHLEFLGLLSAQEMADRMAMSNVLVLPSSCENSSNTLGEAMLIGLPCIASFVGGTTSIVQHNVNSLLYPFGDYEVLASHICNVFLSKVLAQHLSKNGQTTAQERHSPATNAQKMIDIYRNILAGS